MVPRVWENREKLKLQCKNKSGLTEKTLNEYLLEGNGKGVEHFNVRPKGL